MIEGVDGEVNTSEKVEATLWEALPARKEE